MTVSSTGPGQRRRQKASQERLPLAEAISRQIRGWRSEWRRSPQEIRNERLIYAEMPFQAIAGAGAMSFISVFLVRMGSPSWLVGLYSALPALITILAVLPAGAWVQRRGQFVKTAIWGRMLFRIVVGLFALVPYIPGILGAYVLVLARGLVSIPSAVLNVSIQTIWGKGIKPERRPRMLSMRMAIHGVAAAAVGFLAGQWLDRAPFPLNYQMLFVTAFLAGIGSALVLRHIKLPKITAEEKAQQKRVGIKDLLPLIRSIPAFRNFAIAAFIFRTGASLPSALFTIYRVRTLGSSDAWIGILLTVERLLSVVTYLTLSRLLARPRFRRYLWLAGLGNVLFPLTMAMATSPEWLLMPSAIIGLFSGGMNIFLQTTLLRVSPEGQRPTFAAANTFLANITAFVAPMLGIALADATTIRLAFVAASALRLVGVFSFWRLGVGTEK